MNVECIVHSDVRGKEIYYVKISNPNGSVFVNVNKVKYDEVSIFLTTKKVSDVAKGNAK
jgi:hypothetical protein